MQPTVDDSSKVELPILYARVPRGPRDYDCNDDEVLQVVRALRVALEEALPAAMRALLYRALVMCTAVWLLGAFILSQTDWQHLSGRAFYRKMALTVAGESGKAAVPLVMLTLPQGLVVVAALMVPQVRPSWFPNFTQNSRCAAISPWWILYGVAQVVYIWTAYVRHARKQDGYELLAGTANSFAILALINLALFLVPVSKHTPLLLALNVPAVQCSDAHCTCQDLLVNFTGLIAGVCFLAILLSSLEYVRRNHYRLFYGCHIGFACAGCIFAVAHWSRLLLYTLPAVVFHALSTGLWLCEFVLRRRDAANGTAMSLWRLPHSNNVYGLTVPLRPSTPPPSPGQWIRLINLDTLYTVPPSNPISVCWTGVPPQHLELSTQSSQYHNQTLNCFIRSVGPAMRQLTQSEPLRCAVDGYHGDPNRLDECKNHSHVVLLAGGLGITPMFSLLQGLCADHAPSKIQTVELIWASRDVGLIQLIRDTAEYMLEHANPSIVFHVCVYQTRSDAITRQ